MSYMALYRKWRPDAFDEVKGQDHIVTTLKNQIKNNRIGHAFLFCGTRGTGKTTIAKLFAKAVNCEDPQEGSPCGNCPSCQAIARGSAMNVIEIDAASNNGVDNIRQIRDEVQYSPSEGKYLVYIIDEVHMLTPGAFNALLKTLEEPPSYVIFILATTESHKIPITISSRCQKYDFRRISVETISARLTDLLGREGVKAEPKAIDYIAKAADGSMRDSLSILDQCIAFNLGQDLTYDSVLSTIGAVDVDVFAALLEKIIAFDATGAMSVIDQVVNEGRELSRFVSEFTWFLRNVLLLKVSPDGEADVDMTAENVARVKELSGGIDQDTIIRYINVLTETSADIKYADNKRVVLEIAIIKLCRPQMGTEKEDVLERVRMLEKQLEGGAMPQSAPANTSASQDLVEQVVKSLKEKGFAPGKGGPATASGELGTDVDRQAYLDELRRTMDPATYQDMEYVCGRWEDIKKAFRLETGKLSTDYLQKLKLHVNPDRTGLELVYYDDGSSTMAAANAAKVGGRLKEIIIRALGRDINLNVRVAKNSSSTEPDLKHEDFVGSFFKGVTQEIKDYDE